MTTMKKAPIVIHLPNKYAHHTPPSSAPSPLSHAKQHPRSNKCRLRDFVLVGIPLLFLQVLFVHQRLLPSQQDTINANNVVDWTPKDIDKYKYKDTATSTSTSTRNNNRTMKEPDGTFNGYPIYYQETTDPIYSQLHCVGETNQPAFYWRRKGKKLDLTWESRSCHFQFFCFDLDEKEFVIFQDPNEAKTSADLFAQKNPKNNNPYDVTQTIFLNKTTQDYPYGVAVGSINQKWGMAGIPNLRWFPQVRHEPAPTHFYALPADVVLLPFHSLAAFNPGHLVWDDFLPIYTLLQIFQLEHLDLLLVRYQLEEGLWAGCDWRQDRAKECHFMLQKFGPLMVRNPDALPITTQNDPRLELNPSSTHSHSNLVCAKHGLAGLGSLNDHGVKKGHGWEGADYSTTHNHGRGGQLWRFRNYLMDNLGISRPIHTIPSTPLFILFSENSSAMSHRSLDFRKEIQALRQLGLLGGDVRIESHQMKQYSLREQAELVSQAAIYVTGCGGGAVSATFLPKGSSLIVFFGEKGGLENNRHSGKPARLDWDYFNNMAYSRVHWIGQNTKYTGESLNGFVALIQHEVAIIQRERTAYEATL